MSDRKRRRIGSDKTGYSSMTVSDFLWTYKPLLVDNAKQQLEIMKPWSIVPDIAEALLMPTLMDHFLACDYVVQPPTMDAPLYIQVDVYMRAAGEVAWESWGYAWYHPSDTMVTRFPLAWTDPGTTSIARHGMEATGSVTWVRTGYCRSQGGQTHGLRVGPESGEPPAPCPSPE